jgi:hypothetical protein
VNKSARDVRSEAPNLKQQISNKLKAPRREMTKTALSGMVIGALIIGACL